MDTQGDRFGNWLTRFHNYVMKEDITLLPLYQNRIHAFGGGEALDVGLDDLDELYATKEQIQKMRELFEKFANTNPL